MGRAQHDDRPADEPARRVLSFSRASAREVDRLAVERYGLPSIALMENAATELLWAARRIIRGRGATGAVVFCGPGNNGGDGLALARRLDGDGVPVLVVLASDRAALDGDAGVQLGVVERMGLPLVRASGEGEALEFVSSQRGRLGSRPLVVDALLGTGLTRAPEGPALAMIRAIGRLGAEGSPVLAADVPSGLDADTGRALGTAVRADVTVSFLGPKTGFAALEAAPYLGEVVTGSIGVPRALVERFGQLIEPRHPGEDTEVGGTAPGFPPAGAGRSEHRDEPPARGV